MWGTLTMEEAGAWRTYSLERAAALPVGARGRLASAWSLFSGLSSKYLQVHGGHDVPRLPPTGRFPGDALAVTGTGFSGPPPGPNLGPALFLRFPADADSREEVLTELLAQPLTCAHNAARPKSYRSLGFVSFEAGDSVDVEVELSLNWACAVRYVEASSGRMTDLVEIGPVTIGTSAGTANE